MIEIENLVKRYGNVYALDDVSLSIGEGEIVGLLGPNGAGKSTTMNILTGYLSATSGSVRVNGIDILEKPKDVKRQIGYLPEQPPLYLEMTVKEYLNFVYDLKGCTLDREAHLAEICKVVRLEDVYHRLISHLSKGYRQRVGIAQALIGDPPVLIFDEPTVGLDPKQIIEVRNLLRTLGKKHTVILSTHILPEVQAVCERIIIIDRGKIIANAKTEDLARRLEDAQSFRVKICGPQKEVAAALREQSGVAKVEALPERDGESYVFIVESMSKVDIRRSIFTLCAGKNWPMLALEPIGTDLEQIFLRLVEGEKAEKESKKRKGKR